MNTAGGLCRLARERGLFSRWDGIPGLSALLAAGPDAGSFLQAQVTSDVLALAPGRGQPSARLNRAGALLAEFTLVRLPDRGQPFAAYMLVVDRNAAAALADDLRAHVVTEDVFIDDVSTDFDGWLLLGPAAPDCLRALAEGPSAPAETWSAELPLTGDPGSLVLQRHGAVPALGPAVARVALEGGLVEWPADAAGNEAWSWLCLEAGRLQHGVDYLPGRRGLAQTGLEQSVVSLTKGCYLGQEVVARVRTYGSVPEAVRVLLFEDAGAERAPAVDAPGVPVHTEDGKVIGTWASAGWSALWQAPVALAFLDRANRTPGRELAIRLADGSTAPVQVRLSPLHAAAGGGELARRLHERAVYLFSRGDDDGAIGLLQQALRADPSLGEAAEALGVILGRSGRFHEAIDIFKQLEELAPDEPMVHTNLSLFYMKLGDRPEAERQRELATLKRFAGIDDQREATERAAAEAVARRGDAARKLSMFAEVLELDPEDPLALLGAGNALATLERHAEAEPLLGRARAAQPDNSALYLSHGRVLELLGRGEEAATTYRAGVTVASRKGDLQPLREMEHRLLLLDAAR
ncbi:MAG: tetratricopeptide repeat protein [bacterium]|nr:tetratricopeptide repeat protein [bacterium]